MLFGFGSNRSLDGSPAGQFNDTIYERLKLGTFVDRSQQILSPQNARSIDRLGITIPASADFKNLFDSIRGGIVVIDRFRILARTRSIALCESLNLGPIREQPRFEVMQCCMRKEIGIVSNPGVHLLFRIHRIGEQRRLVPCINVC